MSTITQFFTKVLGYAFSWLFSVTDNFAVTLCVTLLVLCVITFPVYLKNAERGVKTAKFNARWKEIKAQTQERYNGNTTIVNRMYYEFKKLNKPKPVYSYIFVLVFEVLFVCGLYSILYRPFTGIVGISAEKVQSLMADYKCYMSEMDLFNIFANTFNSTGKPIDVFAEILTPDELARLTSYIRQMQFCGINLSVCPDIHKMSPEFIIPFINICLVAYNYGRTIFSAKGAKSLPVIVISTLTSVMSVCVTLLVPVVMSLYLIINRVIGVIRRLIIKKIVQKKTLSVSFIDVDLYQFEDIREELLKEDAKGKK